MSKYTIRELDAKERRKFLADTPCWPYLDPPKYIAEEDGDYGIGPTKGSAFRALRVAQGELEPWQ